MTTPTPARRQLLVDVQHHRVYRHPDGASINVGASGRQVTTRIAHLEGAGWVRLGKGSDYDIRYWELTGAGRALLDEVPPAGRRDPDERAGRRDPARRQARRDPSPPSSTTDARGWSVGSRRHPEGELIMRCLIQPWIPIRRISVLANLHGGAARFRTIVAGRSWALLWVRRDLSMAATPPEDRPTMREAIDQADADGWPCGAFQPAPLRGMKPYRCSEPYNHPGDHRAVVDGEITAQWARPVPTTPETP